MSDDPPCFQTVLAEARFTRHQTVNGPASELGVDQRIPRPLLRNFDPLQLRTQIMFEQRVIDLVCPRELCGINGDHSLQKTAMKR